MTDEIRVIPGPFNPRRAAAVDVRRARRALGLSPARFARIFGLALEDLRRYERGAPVHNPVERTLLTLIAHDPEMVRRALQWDARSPHADP